MSKQTVCVLFGGISPEHEVSLRSAECILTNIDRNKYHVIAVGITKQGQWLRYAGNDFRELPGNTWMEHPGNCPVAISPVRGQGLLEFTGDGVRCTPLDIVFPVLHGENGEDGSIQGLLQLAGIACVGPHIAASAASMDKSLTKLIADQAKVRQADWLLVTAAAYAAQPTALEAQIEARFDYPVFVKPAGTGSSVGVSKAKNRAQLHQAIEQALRYDKKVLVEEFIDGHEVEVAVLGNNDPVASVCGEIDAGMEFYSYEAKYISTASRTLIPARITEQQAQQVRQAAVKIFLAMGCQGLSRVDFFVTYATGEVVFNEINTIPGFTSISMYPKLFEASGIPCPALIDRLITLALEAQH